MDHAIARLVRILKGLKAGRHDRGQSTAEYAIILVLAVIVVIVVLQFIGGGIQGMLSHAGQSI